MPLRILMTRIWRNSCLPCGLNCVSSQHQTCFMPPTAYQKHMTICHKSENWRAVQRVSSHFEYLENR